MANSKRAPALRRNRVQLYLTDSEFEKIAKIADSENLTFSTTARDLLVEAAENKSLAK